MTNDHRSLAAVAAAVLAAAAALAGQTSPSDAGLGFAPAAPPVPVGSMAGLPEVADFDGDGDLDVVLACGPCCGMEPAPDAGHVQVLLGDGRGGLQAVGPPIPVGETALRVATGDVDRDGHLDVACIQHSDYAATLLYGDGRGGFSRRGRSEFALHDGDEPHVHSVALRDVDRDGDLDLLATLVNAHALAVHLGDGGGGFTPARGQPFFAHRHPYEQLDLADLDGDGALDAVCTDVRGNGVTVLAGSGTGMFASTVGFKFDVHTPIAGGERPTAMALGDFDGDGAPDLVAVLDERPQAVVMFGDGRGGFRPGPGPLATAVPAFSVRVADFDGDGALDFATGAVQVRGVSVTRGDGGGGFAPALAVDTPHAGCSIAVGDMNGDGRPDLVVSSYVDGAVGVLLNGAR